MSARDDVASLPGGHALADLADRVNGDPGAIRGIARHWRDAAARCGGYQDAVRKSVAELASAWQGSAADGFLAYMGNFGQASGFLEDALRNGAGDLDAAAGALEGATAAVGSICENLLGEVRRFRQHNHNLPAADQTAAVQELVTEAVNAAKPKVDEAAQALSAAMSNFDQHAHAMSTTFSGLPAPGTQPFAPQPGKPVNWTPRAQPPQTYTQGSSPGSATPTSSPTAPSGGHTGSDGSGGGPGGTGGHSGGGGYGTSAGHGGGIGGSGHGGGGGTGSSGGPPPGGGPAPQGQVKEWIDQAIEILRQNGVPVDKMNESDIWAIIQHESGGNPNSINLWDSNAKAGHPSKGLMQCIDSTFNSHALPGHGNIWNPVDNIIAGVRYSVDRYGSVSNVPGVVGMKTGTGYRGY